MLASLKIKNVALIDNMEIDFGSQLNVISGETGSGKSIMLNALGFVIGDRLDKTMLREGADFMKVDAFFTSINENISNKIKEICDIECDGELLISREYNINGKTSCKVNNELVTSASLKRISSLLLDIHGQHEHQALLDQSYQLEILDKFCKEELANKIIALNEYIDKVNAIDKEIKTLGGDEKQKQDLIDLYKYQLEEIERANIKENEYEELETRIKEMKESEKISQNLNETINLLNKNPFGSSASEQINQSKKLVGNLSTIVEKYNILYKRIDSIEIELNDIINELETENNKLSFDESDFELTDKRLDLIKTLYRKYGVNHKLYTQYYEDTKHKLDNLMNGEERYNELTIVRNSVINQILKIEEEITKIRKLKAIDFEKQIEIELKELGMKDARFSIEFSKTVEPFTRTGNDVVAFMFSANVGFEKRPLAKIASGGELSRFMLSYKIVANAFDEIGTMIFDEIDTGISGNIAVVVSNCMARLSRTKQLIVVSHLPQICAMADLNYLVSKVTNEKAKTIFMELDDIGTKQEIARLMGLTKDAGLEVAEKLKLQANDYKNSL